MQRELIDIIGDDEALKAEFKEAELNGRLAYKAGDREGVEKEKARMKELIRKALSNSNITTKTKIVFAKQNNEDSMNKLNDILTALDEIPLKLIIKVSLKWTIGLLPFAIFVLFVLGLIIDLLHPHGR